MKIPLVSIIIPVYNGLKYLEQVFSCIRDQSFNDYELIIIDDGSSDESYDTAKKLTNKFEDRTLVRIKNGGVSLARNKGIELARGKYIAFLDVDDFWISSKLEKQIKILETNKSIGLICSASASKVENNIKYIGKFKKDRSQNFLNTLINNGNFITTSSVVLKKDLIDVNKIRFNKDLRLGEDWLFWIQLSQFTDFYYISEPLVIYNISPFEKYPLEKYLFFYKTLYNEIIINNKLKKHAKTLLLYSNIMYYEGLILWRKNKIKSICMLLVSITLNPIKIKKLFYVLNAINKI